MQCLHNYFKRLDGGGLVTKLWPTFVTPWAVTHQVPLSMRLRRQEYWSGLPFPLPGYLPNPGMEPLSPALQVDSLPLSHQTIHSLNKVIGDWKLRSQRVTSIWKYWWSFYFGDSCNWRSKWQPTPVLLPGESQGRGSLVGCHLWGPTELEVTEVT